MGFPLAHPSRAACIFLCIIACFGVTLTRMFRTLHGIGGAQVTEAREYASYDSRNQSLVVAHQSAAIATPRVPTLIARNRSMFTTDDGYRILTRNVRHGRLLSIASFIHLLHVFGPSACVPINGSNYEVLPIISNETNPVRLKLDNWHKTFVKTRYGCRCLTMDRRLTADAQPDKQAHDDQILAIFAEIGVPLSWQLSTTDGDFTVKDLLDDSIANFDINQPEIEWSVLAYATYIPSSSAITNKFGLKLTFDDIISKLIQRANAVLPCDGMHRLMALTTISQHAGADQTMLSPRLQQSLEAHLSEQLDSLITSQSADGSWPMKAKTVRNPAPKDRPRDAVPRNEIEIETVLSTGHKLEWLLMSTPTNYNLTDTIKRARQYLEHELQLCTAENVSAAFCPYSHAIRAVLDSKPLGF